MFHKLLITSHVQISDIMKKYLLIAVAVVISLASAAQERDQKKVVWVEMDGVTVPLPPKEHPRVFVRSEEIPDLKARMETKAGKKILRKLTEASQPRTPEEEAAEKDRGFRYYAKMRGITSKVQLQALSYLVDGDAVAAREAITSMLDTLLTTSFGTHNDLSRASGCMLMVGGMIYDWCYDQFTPQERELYIKEFIRIAKTMECHYPPKNTEPICGHSSEWMVLRDMLSCGIAIYDEYPDMYHHVVKMLFKDYVPVRDFTYKGMNYHQGSGYVTVRFLNDLNSLWIFDKMGAGPIYDPAQQYVLYDFIYRRRPDGQVLPAGDVNPAPRKRPQSYSMPAMLASSYYKDPYLAYEYERKPSTEAHMLMLELLWRDFDLKGKTPEDLPLTRYSGTPFGWMIARTGWGRNSVVAEMKVNEHFYGNHQHMDGGAFQIYYRGPLAIDSGSYQGSSGGYNSPHNKNYFKRTIAHNSLLVYDPSEKFACWNYGGAGKTEYAANDGGQRMPGDRWDTCRSFDDLLSESYTVGKTLAHGFGPDRHVPEYSYLKGDITKAYTAKVDDVRRSFVFLNLEPEGNADKNPEGMVTAVPAVMVVYDHVVSADPSFKKFWLLHSIEEPQTGTQKFAVSRTKDGDAGKLYCDVLLPEADVAKVGGPGKEFWVFGENYPNAATTRPDPCNERGSWRVEVTPKKAAKEDCFLNVMQVMDKSVTPLPVQRIDGDKVVGVSVSDRVAIFARDSKNLSDSFTFEIPKSAGKSVKVLLTDLAEGDWNVFCGKKPVLKNVKVSSEAGTIYFTAAPGRYTIER